jgi:hypothetical protein
MIIVIIIVIIILWWRLDIEKEYIKKYIFRKNYYTLMVRTGGVR